jgi:hypothetical protein
MEREEKAFRLIRSAYRLHTLDPRQTIASVRAAIAAGVEDQAADTSEAAACA